MELKLLKPRLALNKAFLKVKPNRPEMELFKKNLINLIDTIDEFESEEFHKNEVSKFLQNTYYSGNHYINTKDRKDLVIHNGTTASSMVGVIIEAKSPVNKAEMLRPDKINTKAFQELVLYYLRERIIHKNLEIKHLIATNIYEWFIFDAQLFERLFAQNKPLVRKFIDFHEGRSGGDKTNFFYTEIAAPAIAALSHEITFTHFDIRDYEKPLRNKNPKDDNLLIALFKLLSPEHLLKLPFANDSNSLDKTFYTELLHIIGLTETKEGSKKLIQRKVNCQRNSGSLIESAIVQLDNLDKISRLEKPSQFGHTTDERLFNVALELSITWINRILFLKLLEAQLIKYHKGDKTYAFLNTDKVKNFDDLNTLFFQVLAKKTDERNDEVRHLFANVPYLNSSLFEPTEIEHACLFISQLKDGSLPLLNNSVIKDKTGKKRTGELPVIEYIFEFLNAYDFSSEGSEEIQEDSKRLINASVLGLIFEKINGYKDGSFFTPGFITMYMCRETIRRAVLQKFNDTRGYNCTDLHELYDKIEDRREANAIINSLKLCDPAVGSGHFLVSALNEIIAIKSELRLLQDREGKRLKEYSVQVENDELVVTDEDGKLFEYNPTSKESQRVQEALFHEKQTIIENCLFGVDINPNSVKICRLRLWIELLKNAYYRVETRHATSLPGERELETLPNIDINIKCGNSLISRFALDADLRQALKSSKFTIDSYRVAVDTYRNAQNKEQKREMERLIACIKSDFRSNIDNPFKKKISTIRGTVDNLAHKINTSKQWGEKVDKKLIKEFETAVAKLDKLEKERDDIEANKIYENAFEWRFEFPEVLNDEGDFVGFDVVIGNPPYIPLESFNDFERKFFRSKYLQLERKYETSVPFIIEGINLTNRNGLLSFIAPVTWQTGENYSKFRKYLLATYGIEKIVNLPFDVFEDAYVDTALYFLAKEKKENYSIFVFDKKNRIDNLNDLKFSNVKIANLKQPDFKLYLDSTVEQFSRFDNDNFIQLGQITKSTQGLSGSNFPEATFVNQNTMTFLEKGNVYNYLLVKEKTYKTDLTNKQNLIGFYRKEPKVLIRRIISRQNRLTVAYCDEELIFKKDINPFIPIDKNFDARYLTGILASTFISYLYLNSSSIATKDDFRQTTLSELRKLPIPKANDLIAIEMINLVEKVLVAKASPNSNTSTLESEIDRLVYELYGLTEEEIKIVEGAK